jgi:hypothetical protein
LRRSTNLLWLERDLSTTQVAHDEQRLILNR